MNYEQKYNEALERAKEFYNDKDNIRYANAEGMLEDIFPELKESEDEKVRKTLISILKSDFEKDTTINDISVGDIITWLEKQGEQKVSVVEFNAKDWYVSKVDGKIYNAKFMKKNSTNLTRKLEIEKAAMSATGIIDREEWFIKGAKWADENPAYISSEKQGEQKPAWSKEDRTMAFTLMRDVDQMSCISKEGKNERICWLNSLDEKFASRESSWSEEDERMCQETIDWFEKKCFPYALENDNPARESIKWLKSLKQRLGE